MGNWILLNCSSSEYYIINFFAELRNQIDIEPGAGLIDIEPGAGLFWG